MDQTAKDKASILRDPPELFPPFLSYPPSKLRCRKGLIIDQIWHVGTVINARQRAWVQKSIFFQAMDVDPSGMAIDLSDSHVPR